jgi:hypothetical protein
MEVVSRRKSMGLGIAGVGLLPLAAGVAQTAGLVAGLPAGTKVYEHTLLKAKPGLRAELGKYVVSNWFAMDQKGVEQRIFTSYWLLEESGENSAWDYVVVVGYPTELGYDEPQTKTAFEAIRKAHVEVKIGGKGLRELGGVVGSHRLRVVQG